MVSEDQDRGLNGLVSGTTAATAAERLATVEGGPSEPADADVPEAKTKPRRRRASPPAEAAEPGAETGQAAAAPEGPEPLPGIEPEPQPEPDGPSARAPGGESALPADAAEHDEGDAQAHGPHDVVTLPEPYRAPGAASRRPAGPSLPPPGVSGSVAGESAVARRRPASPKAKRASVDEVTQSGELLLVRQGIRWYRVVGDGHIEQNANGAVQVVGTFSLRPAEAPRADQVSEGAALRDPESDRDPVAYLERLRQNRQIGQHEVWGVERHKNGDDEEESCLVLLFGDQMQIKGLIPAREADEGQGRDQDLRRLIGRMVEFRVLRVYGSEGLAALSRKAAREQRRSRDEAKEGQVRRAVVASVLQGGAFVDVGLGREAWMPASQYDGRYLFDLRKRAIQPGDQFEVKVVKIDGEQITVSRSALRPDLWEALSRRFQQGGEYVGTVAGKTSNRSSLLIEFGDGTVGFSMLPRGGDPPIGSQVVAQVDRIDLDHRLFRVHIVRYLGRGRAS